uniref:Uncharacterized protein n=1 Tax=Oryza punctata TaxID=4537 RepID=A0A0E0LSK9_ORYPU
MTGFISRYPDADLRTAKDGQYVKVTGAVTCGNSPPSPHFKGFQDVCTLQLACMSTGDGNQKLLMLRTAEVSFYSTENLVIINMRSHNALVLHAMRISLKNPKYCNSPDINPVASHFPCCDCSDILLISTFFISNLDGEHWSEQDTEHG